MRKIISLILTAVLLIGSISVYADTSDLTVKTAKIVIKEEQGTGDLASYIIAQGSFTKDYADCKMLVTITKKGVDLTDDKIPDSDKYFGMYQYYIAQDGSFDISRQIDLPTGEYVINITADMYDGKYTIDTEAISGEILTKTSEMLDSLEKGEATKETLTPVLNDIAEYITNDSSVYEALESTEQQEVSKEIIGNLKAFSLNDFTGAFDKAVALVAVNSAADKDEVEAVMDKNIKTLDLESNPLYEEASAYDKSEDIYSFIYDNRNYEDVTEISTAYFDGYVLARFKNAMASNIQGLTGIYKDYIGTDEITGNSNTVSAIESYIYDRLDDVKSITALKELIEDAVDNAEDEQEESSRPSSGGGGGSSNVTVGAGYDNGNYIDTSVKYGFNDVAQGHWGYNAITCLNNAGILSGKGNGMFFPDDNVTRAEFVKILVSAYNIDAVGTNMSFTDVNNSDWYYTYILKAFNAGVISGLSETSFAPGSAITRQDAAVILKRILDNKGVELTQSNTGFSDYDKVSDYAKDAVGKLSYKGIIKGFEDNTFRGSNTITRAEAAQLIYNAIK